MAHSVPEAARDLERIRLRASAIDRDITTHEQYLRDMCADENGCLDESRTELRKVVSELEDKINEVRGTDPAAFEAWVQANIRLLQKSKHFADSGMTYYLEVRLGEWEKVQNGTAEKPCLCIVPQRSPCQLRCGLCALVLGAVLVLLATYSLAILVKFSPIFKTIQCMAGKQYYGDPIIGDPTVVSGNASMYCDNTNSYGIAVHSAGTGRVLVNNETQIGIVEVAPFQMLPKQLAEMSAAITMTIPMSVAVQMVSQHPVHVYLEFIMQATANVDVILGSATFTRDQSVHCAFAMEAAPPVRQGPTVCARTVAELEGKIPAVDSNQTVTFAFTPDPAELSMLQNLINTACGVAIAVCSCGGCSMSCFSVVLLRRFLRHYLESRAEKEPKEAQDVEAEGGDVAAM